MIIITKSGSSYAVIGRGRQGQLRVVRNGLETGMVVAIRPSLIPNFKATTRFEAQDEFLCGFNAHGRRTFRIIPEQAKPGMVLVNPGGHKSTEIVKVS